MSIYSETISGKGIENIPLFGEADKDGWSKLKSDIYGCEFEAYNVFTSTDRIGMQTVLASGNIYDVLYSLAEHYPEKEFHFHEYCHDGYWHDFDFAFKNGEYVKWNYEDGDVYDELEDDEEFD